MRETITLQIGQCGNQIGKEFWERLSMEHGISSVGDLVDPTQDLEDRKDVFFYQADDGKYVPRAILVDLEPRVIGSVISSTKQFFNQENVYLSHEGGGAGNNWAHGYCKGKECKNDILDMIQREAEGSDHLESFFLLHSIAGGTGSGFGSLLLEEIRSEFPKKIIQSYSIFPNNQEVSDVVVQPYNSMLTLHRLSEHCDGVVVMDNGALGRIALESLRIKVPSFHHVNSLISTVICASTSTIRFPSYMYCDQRSILSTLVPFNDLKFIIPSYSPFVSEEMKVIRKTTCSDIMRRLILPKSRMATCENSKTHAIVSTLNILSGVSNPLDVHKSMIRIQDKGLAHFVPWRPSSYHVVLNRKHPLASSTNRVSGLSLTNTTAISSLLTRVCQQYDLLRNRNAFIDIYKRYDTELSEFDESRARIQKIVDEYEKCEMSSYTPT
jgi:tubulin gamma